MTRRYGNGPNGRYQFDETRFLPGQREAAVKLVEYEFATKDERKTKQEIADEIGVTRMTLNNWERRDSNFIAYRNHLAADFFNGYLPFVYKKMIDGIGNGSMRGIELYLKRMGELDSNNHLTINDMSDDNKTHDERKAELMERLKQDEGIGDKE